MERILVSACLLGQRVRYDGGHTRRDSAILVSWEQAGRIVPLCPEIAGGLPTPRPPAEIEAGAGGAAVLEGRARVRDAGGGDATAAFLAGAERALRLAREQGIRIAVLKEGSPSCGSSRIYDGSFGARRIAGEGVTASLLRAHGILVFSEDGLAEADAWLRAQEGRAAPEDEARA